MRRISPAIRVFALLSLSSALVPAQDVFVLPAISGSTTPTVFSADPFNQAAVLSTASPNATFAFAGPSGKFYLISNTNSATVQVTDSSFANLHTVSGGDLAGAVSAAITPDGKHLFVVSSGGLVNIVDTATDKVTQSSLYFGGPVLDIASSLDSSRMYVLVTPASGAQLAVADSTSGASSKAVSIPGTATGISVAPSGLIYVSTQGAILEIDPTSFSIRYTINVTGRPGKLYITPDGKTGIAANQATSNNTAAFVIDLGSRSLTGVVPEASPAVTFDQIFPVGNNRALGFSAQGQSIFDITLNSLSMAPLSFASSGVTAAAVTNNVPTSTNPSTQFLYFASGTTVYRVDLNAGQVTGQQTVSGRVGAMAFASVGARNGTVAAILTYGDNQTIGTNVASAPLVARVVDASGNPLAGVPVTFSTSTAGVSFSSAGVFSDNQGIASTTLSGTAAGTVTVNVTAGTISASYTINIATSGGSTGGNTAGGFSIVAGQGEVVPSTSRASFAGSLLTVQLLDQNNAPVPNQSIVFTIQSGAGTVCDPTGGCNGQTSLTETTSSCSTGATGCVAGQASIDFVGPTVAAQTPGYQSTSITATAPNGNSVTFYLTTVAGGQQAQPNNSFNSGDTIRAQSGQKLVGALQSVIVSQFGNPIPNVGLNILNGQDPTQPAPAACVGGFALSDATGKVSCDLVATAAPGSYPITVNIGYTRQYNLTLVVTPGAPSTLSVVNGDKQSGTPGQKLSPLTVLVADAAGNPQSGVSVSWSVTPASGATLSSTTSVTDAQGHASTTPTLGTGSGTVTVQATVGTLAPKTFTLTITVPVSSIQLVSGGGQSAVLNGAFAAPIVVKVVDASGNALPGIPVTFTANNGGSVGSSSVTTKSDGTASTTVTAGGAAGTITVTARAGNQSVTATLTAIPPGPTNITFLNGASFQSGAVAPGTIVAIQGNGLAANVQGITLTTNIVGPLPTTFQGITVTFNGTAAPIYSVSNVNGVQQVVVQAPYELAGSTSATVNITTSGGGSGSFTVAVAPFAPGIFETTAFGQKQAVALHADGSYVSPANPATRGENITIFLTGLGQTTPATGTNRAGVAGQVVVAPVVGGVNNSGVPVVSVQAAPGLIGVYALTLTVPSDTATGSAQQVQAIAYDPAGNSYYAQGSVIPIQ